MRRFKILPAAFLILGLAGCTTPRSGTATAKSGTIPLPPEPYTRIARDDTNQVRLQIALRKLVPARGAGPAVWLVGTSHVGEPSYYRALQQRLDAQTLVLYEGINAGAHSRRVRGRTESPPAAMAPPKPAQPAGPPGMQSSLAGALGLVFQLDAINYDRTNFLNSDLSVDEIQRIIAGGARGSPPADGRPQVTANTSFNLLLEAMDGSSFLGSVMRMGMQMIGANAKLQALTRLAFIEMLGRLRGDLAAMRGVPPDMQQLIKVLIEARNAAVVEDLRNEMRLVPPSGSIAIFYGTGHMEDMERRITRELDYRPAGDVWLTAFSVDLRASGLSPAEVGMVGNLVKWQLDQMQP